MWRYHENNFICKTPLTIYVFPKCDFISLKLSSSPLLEGRLIKATTSTFFFLYWLNFLSLYIYYFHFTKFDYQKKLFWENLRFKLTTSICERCVWGRPVELLYFLTFFPFRVFVLYSVGHWLHKRPCILLSRKLLPRFLFFLPLFPFFSPPSPPLATMGVAEPFSLMQGVVIFIILSIYLFIYKFCFILLHSWNYKIILI